MHVCVCVSRCDMDEPFPCPRVGYVFFSAPHQLSPAQKQEKYVLRFYTQKSFRRNFSVLVLIIWNDEYGPLSRRNSYNNKHICNSTLSFQDHNVVKKFAVGNPTTCSVPLGDRLSGFQLDNLLVTLKG